MNARNLVEAEAAPQATPPIGAMSEVKPLVRRWEEGHKQLLIVSLLVLSDVAVALAVWQAAFVPQGFWGSSPPSMVSIASIGPNLVVWVGLRALLGLYPGYGMSPVEELRRQTFAVLGTLTITIVFAFASQTTSSLSRMLLFVWSLALLLAAPVIRSFVKRTMKRAGLWGKPVVVFGVQEAGAQVLRVLRQEWNLGFNPVGVFDNREAPTDRMLEGVPYGGTLTEAVALARKGRVDTAIFALPYTQREHLAKFVDLASKSFPHIVVIPNLGGITNSAVVARDLAGTFGVEITLNLLDVHAQRLKRAMDLVATALGGLLILPIILALALLVRLESRGPIFYRDYRMGRDSRLFPCIKFRTMVPDAEDLLRRILSEDATMREEYLTYHKLREDPRVTRVGRFLRKTSLDELPQLWNVLRGDMSLVGPRPYLPRESEDIGEAQSEILRVLPGITGPWQVTGRNQNSFLSRVRMDARYVRDWSVWLDFIILARTVKCLLSSSDAY